jgi:DNA-binding transcriptional regulator YdaS (Cro superfamily)
MGLGPMPDTVRQPGYDRKFEPRRPAKGEGLGLLFAALGGTAAVARRFDRDPSTVSKWRSGALPLPAEVARALHERTEYVIGCLQTEARRLEMEIPAAERRAADGHARRRRAFLRLLCARGGSRRTFPASQLVL